MALLYAFLFNIYDLTKGDAVKTSELSKVYSIISLSSGVVL